MAASKNPFLIQDATAGRSYGRAKSLAAPLFLIHDASGNIFSYLKLGLLGGTRIVYGISDPHFGHEGGAWLSIDDLARHYIKLVKKVMLRGDILLGGELCKATRTPCSPVQASTSFPATAHILCKVCDYLKRLYR